MTNRILLMKLVFFWAFCFTLFAKANIKAQNVTLSVKNEQLNEVMLKFKQQLGISFFFKGDNIASTRITADINNEELHHAMNKILEGKNLEWNIKNGIIYIRSSVLPLSSGSHKQQPFEYAGTVVDEKGEPMPGVSVAIKGTNQGTATDSEGRFRLSSQQESVTLIVSMVGYVREEIQARPGRNLKITLQPTNSDLQEVVVVGYGVQKRENLTGAVATVDMKKSIEGRAIPDLGRGLQGTVPGLTVTVPDGEVGSDPQIRIRGAIGSIEGGASPLILLDNVEIPSIQVVNPDDIESISVLKDAASASIYGSKAAFGVVLITTKKGGKSDKNTVSYTGLYSTQNMAKDFDMAGVEGLQYMLDARAREKDNSRTGHYSYDGLDVGAYFRVDQKSLQRSYEWAQKYGSSLSVNDPMVYGRDWYYEGGRVFGVRQFNIYDYMIRENAPTNQHNVTVNGSAGKTNFNVGLGFLGQSGMMKTAQDDSFTKYNASTRIETNINDWLKIRSGVVFSSRNKKYPFLTESTSDGPWLYLYRWSPLVPLGYNEDGEVIRSPMSETMQASSASMKYNYVNLNGGLTLEPIKKWVSRIDYAYSNQEYIHTLPGSTLSGADYRGTPVPRLDASGAPIYVDADGVQVDPSTPGAMQAYKLPYAAGYNGTSKPNLFKREHENSYRHTLNIASEYTLPLQVNHDLKFLVGMNLSTYDATDQETQVTNLSDFQNPQFSFGTGTWTGGGGADWESQLGYFGRVNYAFKNRYLLEGNLRYDGTSKFPDHLRWKWFPSFSAGWRVSEEPFMQWLNPVVSSLKLRSSWGSIGDQTVSSSLYIPTMVNGQNTWIGGNGSLLNYVGTPSAVSAAISWQEIETFDVGIDGSLWNGKIGFNLDWFERHTKSMIVSTDGVNELTYGTGAPKANNGGLKSRGWELAVDANHRFDNGLGISLMASVSDVRSIITKYGNTRDIDDYYVGKNFGEIWGFKADRLYQWSDFETDNNGNLVFRPLTESDTDDPNAIGKPSYILKSGPNGERPVYQSFFQGSSFFYGPGDVKFVDVNGDGRLTKGSQTTDDKGDLTVIGNETPRYEYSFRLGTDFKGFDLSMYFQGVGKRQIWGDGPLAIPGWKTSDGAMAAAFAEDYWTVDNPNAFYPAPYNLAGGNDEYNLEVSDRYLLNMAYLRLKNLTLGYNIPKKALNKLNISKLRVYATAENLFTWDNLRGLPIDPEVVTGFSMWGDNFSQGRTGVSTPSFKTFSFGIQLNL